MQGRPRGRVSSRAGLKPISISGTTPFTWPALNGIFHFVQAGEPWDERRYELQSEEPKRSRRQSILQDKTLALSPEQQLNGLIYGAIMETSWQKYCMLVCQAWDWATATKSIYMKSTPVHHQAGCYTSADIVRIVFTYFCQPMTSEAERFVVQWGNVYFWIYNINQSFQSFCFDLKVSPKRQNLNKWPPKVLREAASTNPFSIAAVQEYRTSISLIKCTETERFQIGIRLKVFFNNLRKNKKSPLTIWVHTYVSNQGVPPPTRAGLCWLLFMIDVLWQQPPFWSNFK